MVSEVLYHLTKHINCVLLYGAAPNVFSLPVFTPDFCEKLMEELENFEASDLPKGRPNTMNKGGVSDHKSN